MLPSPLNVSVSPNDAVNQKLVKSKSKLDHVKNCVNDGRKVVPIIDIRTRNNATYRTIRNHKGEIATTDWMALNIHVKNENEVNLHSQSKHWPLKAAIRELIANSMDSVIESASFVVPENGTPVFETVNSYTPLGGTILINDNFGASYCITVERVYTNPMWQNKTNHGRGMIYSEFTELDPNRDKKRRLSKDTDSHGKKAIKREDNGEDDDVFDDEDDDDDESNEHSAGGGDDDDSSSDVEFVGYHHSAGSSDAQAKPPTFGAEEAQVVDESTAKFRINLYIKNVGSVLPLEAWINNYSTKHVLDPFRRKLTIGGFGYGLKDSVLSLYQSGFKEFQVFVSEPKNKKYPFYRGILQQVRMRIHNAKTLSMNFSFHKNVSPTDIPTVIKKSLQIYISDSKSSSLSSEMKNFCTKGKEADSKTVPSVASTIVAVGKVVTGYENIREALDNLLEAVRPHSIFGRDSFFTELDRDRFIREEVYGQDKGGNSSCKLDKLPTTRSAKSSGRRSSKGSSKTNNNDSTQASSSSEKNDCAVEKDVEEKVTLSVDAEPVMDDDTSFEALVTTFPAAQGQSAIKVSTWPGIEMVTINDEFRRVNCQGICYSHQNSLRFGNFLLMPPESHRKNLQRDRVVQYDNVLPLLGSVIIAACKKEKDEAVRQDLFPDMSRDDIASLNDVLGALRGASKRVSLCFNIALIELLVDGLEREKTAELSQPQRQRVELNGNLVQLLSNSAIAQNYIIQNLLLHFYAIRSSNEMSATVYDVIRAERTRHSAQIAHLADYDDSSLKTPLVVPDLLFPLFQSKNRNEHKDVSQAAKALLFQLACVSPPFSAILENANADFVELLESRKKHMEHDHKPFEIMVDLDVDPMLLQYLAAADHKSYASGDDEHTLVRIPLSHSQTITYYNLQKSNPLPNNPPTECLDTAMEISENAVVADGVVEGSIAQQSQQQQQQQYMLVVTSSQWDMDLEHKVIHVASGGDKFAAGLLREKLRDKETRRIEEAERQQLRLDAEMTLRKSREAEAEEEANRLTAAMRKPIKRERVEESPTEDDTQTLLLPNGRGDATSSAKLPIKIKTENTSAASSISNRCDWLQHLLNLGSTVRATATANDANDDDHYDNMGADTDDMSVPSTGDIREEDNNHGDSYEEISSQQFHTRLDVIASKAARSIATDPLFKRSPNFSVTALQQDLITTAKRYVHC